MEQKQTVTIKIDGKEYKTEEGKIVLEACQENEIEIPTLCYLKGISAEGACGICLVEVETPRGPVLQRACILKATEGLKISTNTPSVQQARKLNLELILARHPLDCMTCEKDGDCVLQNLAYEFGIKQSRFYDPIKLSEKEATPWDFNPFIEFNPQKCVRCKRCVNTCRNKAMAEALAVVLRGDEIEISTFYGKPLEDVGCQFCGQCTDNCPVGALVEKTRKGRGKKKDLTETKTICAYCGVGCALCLFCDRHNNLVLARGAKDGPINNGRLCVKGKFGLEYVNSPDRLKTPLIRENGELHEATWGEAISYVARKLSEIKEKYGPEAIGVLGSSRCTNEDNYLLVKWARGILGTPNIDNCARLCHSSTVVGLGKALGAGAATNSIEDIKDADVMFVIGSNTTEAHPVIGQLLKENKVKNGAKLIVCDPRLTDIAKAADIHLAHNPGTDVALLNGIMSVIIGMNLHNKDFVGAHTENFEDFKRLVEQCDLETTEKITGVDREIIVKVATLYSQAKAAMIFYTMGITQHTTGVDNVVSLANLALLTGHIGKRGAGIMALRGQANVQGACDVGALPNVLPGYAPITDEFARKKFEDAWGVEISGKAGLPVTEFAEKILSGEIKAVYIMGENPMMTEADIAHARKAFEKLEFLVVQDIFLSETAEIAHVVLPAAAAYEKDGTFTNTDRSVQLLRPARRKPVGVRYDWEIIREIARAMGYEMHYDSPSEIMDELASLVPAYGGINYARLEKSLLRWPCPDTNHQGTLFLHEDGNFKRPNGRGLFSVVKYRPAAELPDEEYPFILTTGRMLSHYHSGNETRRVKSLHKFVPRNYVEINPKDAERLRIKDGELVSVSTRRGSIEINARISDRPKRGVIFISFHFREAAANLLTNPALDPVSKIPEFKVCAAKITKI